MKTEWAMQGLNDRLGISLNQVCGVFMLDPCHLRVVPRLEKHRVSRQGDDSRAELSCCALIAVPDEQGDEGDCGHSFARAQHVLHSAPLDPERGRIFGVLRLPPRQELEDDSRSRYAAPPKPESASSGVSHHPAGQPGAAPQG